MYGHTYELHIIFMCYTIFFFGVFLTIKKCGKKAFLTNKSYKSRQQDTFGPIWPQFPDPCLRSSEGKRALRNISRSHYKKLAMDTGYFSKVKGQSSVIVISVFQ